MDVWLERLSDEMESSIAGLSTEQMGQSPVGKWNVANILEHLAMAFGATAKGLEEALAESGVRKIPAAAFGQRVSVFVVIELGYFPTGRKAPAFVQPTGSDAETSLRRFRENLRRMDAALTEATQRWGSGKIAVHPIFGPLAGRQWRKFHYIHTCHHAKQVRALRAWSAKNKAA